MCNAHVDTVIPVGLKCMQVVGANNHVTFELQVTLFTLVSWSFSCLLIIIFWQSLLVIYKKHLNIRLLYVDVMATYGGAYFPDLYSNWQWTFLQTSTAGIEISLMIYFSNQIQSNWFQAYIMYYYPTSYYSL